MRRALLVTALLLALVLAGCTTREHAPPGPGPAGQETGLGTDRYYLQATLEPPVTRYEVIKVRTGPALTNSTALDVGGFHWTRTEPCGRFTTNESRAEWYHGEDTDCSHASTHHPGTIRTVVGPVQEEISSTGYMTCEYTQGSSTGRGEACFVSSTEPAGEPKAKPIAIPLGGTALALAALATALVARRSRPPRP